MKVLEKYYQKIYKYTDRLLKKVFKMDIIGSMKEFYRLRIEIENEIEKPIDEISEEDLIKYKLSYRYCKYKTLDNILSVVSGVAFLNSFYSEDVEDMKNESK
jgi:hypothetical protein